MTIYRNPINSRIALKNCLKVTFFYYIDKICRTKHYIRTGTDKKSKHQYSLFRLQLRESITAFYIKNIMNILDIILNLYIAYKNWVKCGCFGNVQRFLEIKLSRLEKI